MVERAVSIAFQTDKPVTAYGDLGEAVEHYGFDGVSVYNDLYYQPSWPALFEIARRTKRVRLGPAAVNPFLTHPITIAGQIALLDELCQGRAYLGLARGGWLDQLNIRPAHPITALKEAFACIRHLLRQEKTPFEGTVFMLAGGDTLRWPIRRRGIPFLLGSWGKKTIQACIDAVAEVKVGGTANGALVAHMRAMLSKAAATKELAPTKVRLVVGAVTVVDRDGRAARERARREVALYLPVVARLDPTIELAPEWLARFGAAVHNGDDGQAAALISDELLSHFALTGTPDEVIEQAAGLFSAGADRVEFGTPHGLSTSDGLNLLGREVLPALRGLIG